MGIFIGPNSGSHTNDELSVYEEGTWTPGLDGSTYGGNSYGYTARHGNYVKIGRHVTCSFYLTWNNYNGTGAMNITGLPFSTWNTNSIQHAGPVMTMNLGYPSNGVNVVTHNWNGVNYFRMYGSYSGGGWDAIQVDGAGGIIGTLSYFAAQTEATS